MKKRFYNMAAAYDFLDQHLSYETSDLTTDISTVDNKAFPLFLPAHKFYILLDNSLGDGRSFFKRDKDGNVRVKVTNLDYDEEDPDMLLYLEHSDNEDEGIEETSSSTTQSYSKYHTEQWTKVTALYFKEFIWPTISHQCGITSKEFDPLLVWIEIQSFIKGSETALRKGAHLDLEEYKQVGGRMAPNFSSYRDTIYKLFLRYQWFKQNQRHCNYMFDECDLVLHLYNRLKQVQDVPWSIHSLYIDEVQDFTQAELAVLVHCCRDPNSVFFTGDTAQCIMRGISFRFQDLRSIFHRINSKFPVIKVPQKPHNLTINFRSHSGILKLAGSIIDLIRVFFYDSIDHLPDDVGMFHGPAPILLKPCETKDLALLLSRHKRTPSSIEYGAHQAILVQSREAKDSLPPILKGAIRLTIFEAKGLEFDDVLLYNFFTDSMVDEKCWRVVSSYLQYQKLMNSSELKSSCSSGDPRSQPFDPNLHKSLSSELKYLYTAITRAKCNLWIYDSGYDLRFPMFDYWKKRNLFALKAANEVDGVSKKCQEGYSQHDELESTSDQWKAQGDNLKKRHLWEQAILCYEYAGKKWNYLAEEARAFHLIQQARDQKPQLYLEAALAFLECDEQHHDLRYLKCAAVCLKKSKPPKHQECAKLLECLGESKKAAQYYLKANDIKNYARLKENMGQHDEVIRTLMGRPQKRHALVKASEYEKQDIILPEGLGASELSYILAKFYRNLGDKKTLSKVLAYMPEVIRKVKILKEAGLYEKAFKVLVEKEKLHDAYRLASAQGGCRQDGSDYNKTWLMKGLNLAKNNKDETRIALFVFQMAKVEYLMMQADNNVVISREVNDTLHTQCKSKNQLIRAQAHLLFGVVNNNDCSCRVAKGIYHRLGHKIGELEAFNQMMLLATTGCKLDEQSLLNMCHLAKEAGHAFMKGSCINKTVKEGLDFYGFQKIGDHYHVASGQNMWIKGELMNCGCKHNEYDLDGMLKLKICDVQSVLAKHCQTFKDNWLSYSDLKSKLKQKQTTFSLHRQILDDHCLQREYCMAEVSAEALRQYLQAVVHLLELRTLIGEERRPDRLIQSLVCIFSPEVYMYLPERIKVAHIVIIRRSVHSHSSFQLYIKHTPFMIDSSDRLSVESWLRAWRASCISQPQAKLLFSILNDFEKQVNHKYVVDGVKPQQTPPGFIFWKKEKKLRHIFLLWLTSCVEIRENGNFLWASKLTVFYFLGTVAKNFNKYHIRVMSIVDILSVYCTGLFVMLTQSISVPKKHFVIPLSYKNSVQLFDLMNTWEQGTVHHVFSACSKVISSCKQKSECFIGALEILLGTNTYNNHFSLLRFSLSNIISTDAAKQCLILVLVLLVNLSMFRVQEIDCFHQKIGYFYQVLQSLLHQAMSRNKENTPKYILMAYETITVPIGSTDDIFYLVQRLLQDAKVDTTLAQLVFMSEKCQGHKVEVKPIHSSAEEQAHVSKPFSVLVPPPPGFTPGLRETIDLAGSRSADRHLSQLYSAQVAMQNPAIPTSSAPTGAAKYTSVQQHAHHDKIPTHSANSLSATLLNSSSTEQCPPLVQQVATQCHTDAYWEQTQLHSTDFHQEEEDMALTCGAIEQWFQINPELIDPEIVTPTFCNACGVHLKTEHNVYGEIEEVDLEVDDMMPMEKYDNHVFSRFHESNVILCKQFTAILSNEKGSELYPRLRRELKNLLQDCIDLQDEYGIDKLNRYIDDIEEELERNDKNISHFEESYSWRKAIEEISQMAESMDRLMVRCRKAYIQISEELKQTISRKGEDVHYDTINSPESMEKEIDVYFSEHYETEEQGLASTMDLKKLKKRKKH